MTTTTLLATIDVAGWIIWPAVLLVGVPLAGLLLCWLLGARYIPHHKVGIVEKWWSTRGALGEVTEVDIGDQLALAEPARDRGRRVVHGDLERDRRARHQRARRRDDLELESGRLDVAGPRPARPACRHRLCRSGDGDRGCHRGRRRRRWA